MLRPCFQTLPLYQLVFPQSFFEACKPMPNIQQIAKKKSRQHSVICSAANTEVSQTDSCVYQPTIWNHDFIQPTIWNHDFIQALDNEFPINCKKKMRELVKKVDALNLEIENGNFRKLKVLEHIDDIERLGLGYRFQNHIRRALDIITSRYGLDGRFEEEEDNLHEASLRFRILRQYGYNVSQDFLRRFKDPRGGFMGILETDVKGLLSLYEASHLAFIEESDLHDAKLFATENLLKLKDRQNDAQVGLEHIDHALEAPLYHRMLRLQARCYIDAYNTRQDANLLLLELATLDFNFIQAAYKTELKQVSKWWKNTGLAHKSGFVRDRLMECFIWTVGVVFEPEYSSCRVWLTKVCTLITVIDDIYDVYGTIDELEIFTNAVKRWDIDAMEQMPECLQQGFSALYNTINKLGSNILILHGVDFLPFLVKVWGELFEAFLVEAKWSHDKHIPTLEVYLDNAWRSVSGVVILTHGYFLINKGIKKDAVESLEKYHDLMKCSSMVFRLYNDLATSSNEIKNGKSVNAISCYMNEKDVSEDVAREYITTLVDEAWKELIKLHVACFQEFADPLIDMAINLARISRCTYQYGDGHGAPDARAKDRVLSVIINPITIKEREHVLI